MRFFEKKHFSCSTILPKNVIKDLLLNIPKLDEDDNRNFTNKKYINNNSKFDRLVPKNWASGTYQLNKNQLKKLSESNSVKKIKEKLIYIHKLKNNNLILKSSCIFYPQNCRYIFKIGNQKYLYHRYHIDSNYKIKALITLKDSSEEKEQFSYIEKFPEKIFFYYLKRHYIAKVFVFFQQLFYFLSLKKIKFSGQPPKLPNIYQDEKLFKKYNYLKLGEMITFSNLYPHSSHTGFSNHVTPMLQLVFDKN